jgi:hypothetical protein
MSSLNLEELKSFSFISLEAVSNSAITLQVSESGTVLNGLSLTGKFIIDTSNAKPLKISSQFLILNSTDFSYTIGTLDTNHFFSFTFWGTINEFNQIQS